MNIEAKSIVVIVIKAVNQQNKYLLLRRKSDNLNDQWLYIAGGILPHETALMAARRELKEEIGLEPHEIYSADKCELFYSGDNDSIRVAPIFFTRVPDDTAIILNEEHIEYSWCNLEEALNKLVMPMQKEIMLYMEQYLGANCKVTPPKLKL